MNEANHYKPSQSFRDLKNEPRLSWADVHYNQVNELARLRHSDMQEFRQAVTAFEITLAGHVDDIYLKEELMLERKTKHLTETVGGEKAYIFYYDEKAKMLVKLAVRVHKEIPLIRDNVINSQIVLEVAHNLNSGLGQNCFFTGKPGVGKSHASIDFALNVLELTNKDFSVIKHVCFTPTQFAKTYNDIALSPEGSCIIIDEIGVNFNSRDALTKSNKVFAKLMQIIRHRALLVIFNAPDLSFMDSAGRKLLHWWFEGVKLDKSSGHSYFKPHTVEVIQATGKILYPFPVYDGQKFQKLEFNRLPEEVILEYETAARVYKDKLAQRVEEDLNNLGKKKPNLLYDKYVELRNSGLSKPEVTKRLELHRTTATGYEKKIKEIRLGLRTVD